MENVAETKILRTALRKMIVYIGLGCNESVSIHRPIRYSMHLFLAFGPFGRMHQPIGQHALVSLLHGEHASVLIFLYIAQHASVSFLRPIGYITEDA